MKKIVLEKKQSGPAPVFTNESIVGTVIGGTRGFIHRNEFWSDAWRVASSDGLTRGNGYGSFAGNSLTDVAKKILSKEIPGNSEREVILFPSTKALLLWLAGEPLPSNAVSFSRGEQLAVNEVTVDSLRDSDPVGVIINGDTRCVVQTSGYRGKRFLVALDGFCHQNHYGANFDSVQGCVRSWLEQEHHPFVSKQNAAFRFDNEKELLAWFIDQK